MSFYGGFHQIGIGFRHGGCGNIRYFRIIRYCLDDVLVPFHIEYMELITFILLIAAFVQFVELFIKKSAPALYKSLVIYLPLITTNCAVLFVAQDNIAQGYDLVHTMVNSIAIPAGFALMLLIFASIRTRLQQNDIPKAFQGNPIAMICAAIMAVAFSALAGLV